MTSVVDEGVQHLDVAEQALATFDVDVALEHLSAAIRGFTAAGDRRRAAMACARLGDVYAQAVGNLTAARVWFRRAARLVEDEPPCLEQGWVAVASLGCDVDDPAELLAAAELALERARRFGDVNLEAKALADGGLAQVQAGRMAEGMALLDEAMALICGPVDDLDAAGRSVCSFLTACYYSGDFERARSWADVLGRHGLVGSAAGVPVLAGNHCDAVRATALCELGRWDEAETLLDHAIEVFEGCMPVPSWHPAIALAELRIRQGRFTDAEALLVGKDGHVQALLPAARLHLARGDHDLARATALRGLRAVRDDRLRGAELLALLVDVELGAGDLEAAEATCRELLARAGQLDVPGLRTRVASVRARVLTAAGDRPAAVATLEAALDALPAAGHPLLEGTLLVQLVRYLGEIGDRAAATVAARRAVATLGELDVVLAPDDVTLLRRYGAGVPTGPLQVLASLRRDEGCWVVASEGMQGRLRDSKGLRYLAELLASPGVERHALDLVDRVEGTRASDEPSLDRRRLGDAGELADSRARAAYRRRIEELRAEIDAAFEVGAEERAEVLQGEVDALVDQLATAFGLAGRPRRASSAAERARLNVTRALRAATERIREVLPGAGAVLDRRVRTGLYCAYEPDEADEVRWSVHS